MAPSPSATQTAARMPIPATHREAAFAASSASSLRGNARNVMPKAFTKQVAASAAVKANSEPAIGKQHPRQACPWFRSPPAAPDR